MSECRGSMERVGGVQDVSFCRYCGTQVSVEVARLSLLNESKNANVSSVFVRVVEPHSEPPRIMSE